MLLLVEPLKFGKLLHQWHVADAVLRRSACMGAPAQHMLCTHISCTCYSHHVILCRADLHRLPIYMGYPYMGSVLGQQNVQPTAKSQLGHVECTIEEASSAEAQLWLLHDSL